MPMLKVNAFSNGNLFPAIVLYSATLIFTVKVTFSSLVSTLARSHENYSVHPFAHITDIPDHSYATLKTTTWILAMVGKDDKNRLLKNQALLHRKTAAGTFLWVTEVSILKERQSNKRQLYHNAAFPDFLATTTYQPVSDCWCFMTGLCFSDDSQ